MPRLNHLVQEQVDAGEAHLGQLKPPETDFGQPFPAADVENAVAWAWLEPLHQKLRERVVPPAFAQVLERRRGQAVDNGHTADF